MEKLENRASVQFEGPIPITGKHFIITFLAEPVEFHWPEGSSFHSAEEWFERTIYLLN